MPARAASLSVELTHPQTVGGQRAAFQSLWLLVRLRHAHERGELVRLAELRGAVSGARTLRMVVSRAFRDFQAWGLSVGWGEDTAREPRFLHTERRSQGPFWLPAGEARRLRLLVEGREATPAEVAGFLGLPAPDPGAPAPEGAPPDAVHLQDAAFWKRLVSAQQAMQQGRLLTPVTAGSPPGGTPAPGSALEAIRDAAALAASDFQRALVLLNEAMLWRRLGDDAQARKRLAALRRQRLAHHVAGNGYLDAMERMVSAWCAYTARELGQARSLLESMTRAPRAAVLRHHPDVRFEWSNLWALVCRSRALALATQAQPLAHEAAALARESLSHFSQALSAAFESRAFDAAQHVAANLGMAGWLFDRVGLADAVGAPPQGMARDGRRDAATALAGDAHAEAARRAIQWIAFSEWLCARGDHQGRSAWNAIYLMRIARGDCRAERPSLAAFRAQRPLRPADMRAQAGDFADAFATAEWPARWSTLARMRLADHDAGRRRLPALQQASLLFEQAWYAAHEGHPAEAAQALTELRGVLPRLVASDRAYFAESWNDALPTDLADAVRPPRRPAGRG